MSTEPRTPDEVWETFESHVRPAYGWALRILRHPAEARRAVHQVALKVQIDDIELKNDTESRHRLYRMTVAFCLKELKKRTYTDSRDPEGYARAALTRNRAQGTGLPLDGNAAFALLGRLRDRRMAMAAYLLFCEGMNHEEAGRVLRLAERTVASLEKGFVHWANLQLLTLRIPAATRADSRSS